MPEVVLILVIALIVFGPRKLPELGKSLGQAMSQFRRASEDFKRTWEQEVDIDKVKSTGTASTALSTTNPEASGYSSDYYSYGYEPEHGSGEQSSATAEPVTTQGTAAAGSTSPASGTADTDVNNSGTSGTPVSAAPAPEKIQDKSQEKSHWI
jgi:TatA/E family protein of Tat protein translocase